MKSSLLLTLSAISLLAACDGGNGITESKNGNGGGGAGGDAGITSGNALAVSKVTYQAALAAGAAAELSGGTGLLASAPSPILKIDGSFATANAIGAATASDPILPMIEDCPEGGTSTLSGEVADLLTPTLTPGDFFDIAYTMCDDGFSVIDGNLHYVVDAFNGILLAGTYDLTMTASFTDFQVATAEDTLVSNGDVTVRLNTLQFPFLEAETSGNSLTIDGIAASQTLTNFASSHSQSSGLIPLPYSQYSSGTLNSTLLPGVVNYSTPVTFTGFDADYPSSGEFLISGENSSARLIAVDNVNITVEVDTDGDGVVDDTIETTWAELEAS